ncbi:MAG TPA: hypothetical protein VFW95_00045 [Candidatus Limnocylindria bacterium]|nr:hypothetical protein [Candidatus Limnocylindria bacterium]
MITWGLALALFGLMTGTIAQGFGDARSRARQGIVGDWVYSDHTRRSASGINAHPQAAQVTTVTMTDQGDDDDVVITINGVDVEYNTGTGKALAAIGAEFAAAINAEPLVRGQVAATFDTATLTLTGTVPGLAFTVSIASDPDSVLSDVTAVTAADEADPVPFGRTVVHQGFNASEGERLVATPYAALFTPQVITATVVTGVATTRAIRVYEIRGDEKVLLANTVFAGSATEATEAAAIATAINLALPAATVIADDDSTAVTFTAEVAGLEFQVEIEQVTAGDITFANTTGPSAATSLWRAFQGISLYSPSVETTTVGGTTAQYRANEGVHYATRGVVWVESSETPAAGGTVYVETTAGANQGRLYAASSATRIALPKSRARWERDGLVAADGIAAVRLEA